MKIAVLNGSPKKPEKSVTMRYIFSLRETFFQHDFSILNISDIFFENKEICAFKGKYTISFSTSIHFFDHLAHDYINAISDDLDMKYYGAYSADTYDLLKKKEQDSFIFFFDSFFKAIANNVPTVIKNRRIEIRDHKYSPLTSKPNIYAANKKILVITDHNDQNTNLGKMIGKFRSCFTEEIEIVDISAVKIENTCTGCLKCGYDNKCIYSNDGFLEFYEKLQESDILIFAGEIEDRFLSSIWKLFFDRAFFAGHFPKFINKQLAFIISGPLSQTLTLREFIESFSEAEMGNLVGIISDEYDNSITIDKLLEDLASKSVSYSKNSFSRPITSRGLGGIKIHRDNVWGRFRFIFQSDHKKFKKYGLYDFPHRNIHSRMFNFFMILFSKIPGFRKILYKKAVSGMVMPFYKMFGNKQK